MPLNMIIKIHKLIFFSQYYSVFYAFIINIITSIISTNKIIFINSVFGLMLEINELALTKCFAFF